MSEPLISVIIPVFKAEDYLRQCVDSIRHQSYRNLEIILVDDGGTDRCPAMCDDLAREDSRIVCIHVPNSGVSAARNIGMSQARGDYLMYQDADDWLDPDACQCAIQSALLNDADVVFWPFVCEYADDGTKSRLKHIFPEQDHLFSDMEVRNLYRLFVGPYDAYLRNPALQDRLSSVWGKLYKTSLICDQHICFEDISRFGSEDTLFNIQVFSRAQRAVYINQPWYHYRKVSPLTLTAAYKPDLSVRFFQLFQKIREILETNHEDSSYYRALDNRIVLSLIGLGQNEARNPAGIKASTRALRAIITDPVYRKAITDFPMEKLPGWARIFFGLARYEAAFLLCIGLRLTKCVRQLLRR